MSDTIATDSTKSKEVEEVTGYRWFHYDLKHYDFQWQIGSNTDHNDFNDTDVDCIEEGLYFCKSIKDVMNFKCAGQNKIGKVILHPGVPFRNFGIKTRAKSLDLVKVWDLSSEDQAIDFIKEHKEFFSYFSEFIYQNISLEKIIFLDKELGLTAKDLLKRKNIIIYNACKHGRLDVIKYIFDKVPHDEKDLRIQFTYQDLYMACSKGHVEVVDYLHKVAGFTIEDFRRDNCCSLRHACYNSNPDLVKYLHKEVGLTYEDFHSNITRILSDTCQLGHLEVLKYLHQEVGFTVKDFRIQDDKFLYHIYFRGHVDLAKYLINELGIKLDFYKDRKYEILNMICKGDNLDMVKYLHTEMGFTAEDFRMEGNFFFHLACKWEHMDIARYLHDVVGLL